MPLLIYAEGFWYISDGFWALKGQETNDVFKVIWAIFTGKRHFKSLTEETCGSCFKCIYKCNFALLYKNILFHSAIFFPTKICWISCLAARSYWLSYQLPWYKVGPYDRYKWGEIIPISRVSSPHLSPHYRNYNPIYRPFIVGLSSNCHL